MESLGPGPLGRGPLGPAALEPEAVLGRPIPPLPLNVTLKPKYLGWWGLPSEQAPLGNVEGFPGGSDGKASARNAGDLSLIPGSGRSPGEGNGNPLQYSCLENPMDGAW